MSCHYPLVPRGPCTDRGSEAFPEQLRLRSLVLERLRIRQSWIENLLTCTPNLDTLKLIGTDKYYTGLRSDKWDWPQFRTHLQSLGLPRKHFHYSQSWHHVLDPEPLEADLTICPNSKERTFIYNDLTPQVIKFLWEQPVFLTSLELIMHEYTNCVRDGWSLYRKKSFNARPLHQLLCECTNLRYLKTLKMPCIVEFMDIHRRDPLYPTLLEHQYDRDVSYNSDEHGEEEPSPLNIPGIWICRGLEILHLEFHVHNNANVKGTHHSRILYGYISSVCPRLRDLRVRFPHFCPSPHGGHNYKYQPYVLEGGLCLLSRLRYLERLCIWHGFTICEKAELSWVARSGRAESHRARRREIVDGWAARLVEEAIPEITRLQNNAASALHDILGPGAQDEKVMNGLKNLGLLQDVADMVAEMDTDEFVCLPEISKVAFGIDDNISCVAIPCSPLNFSSYKLRR
ncbi:hypothetical protein BGX24_002192 [Mortierella sp. AD032]|nr:hypothetical protein BGX24_002192 [Mortierella sp. AD032]